MECEKKYEMRSIKVSNSFSTVKKLMFFEINKIRAQNAFVTLHFFLLKVQHIWRWFYPGCLEGGVGRVHQICAYELCLALHLLGTLLRVVAIYLYLLYLEPRQRSFDYLSQYFRIIACLLFYGLNTFNSSF
jgi:hypothetical protein